MNWFTHGMIEMGFYSATGTVALERSSSKRRQALPAVATRGLGAGSPHLAERENWFNGLESNALF
ncbi:MAG: hypothetical protein FWF06_02705 [Symbiobacteriaceae bacterium]|nr:hypothetical protein [Symbiobacteriaceae bacterium]